MISTEPTTAVATWIAVETGNDNWWRAEAPAAAVGGKALVLPAKEAERAFTSPNKDTAFPWSVTADWADGKTSVIHTEKGWRSFTQKKPQLINLSAKFHEAEGTVIWTRPGIARATLAKSMRTHMGIRTVGETDDNYFANINLNLTLRHMKVDDVQRLDFAKAMASMNACIFSTKWLRDRYYKEFRKHFD